MDINKLYHKEYKKKPKFNISKEDLQVKVDEYLAGGGIITKVETSDSYYSTNPVNSENFSKSKGPISVVGLTPLIRY